MEKRRPFWGASVKVCHRKAETESSNLRIVFEETQGLQKIWPLALTPVVLSVSSFRQVKINSPNWEGAGISPKQKWDKILWSTSFSVIVTVY